MKPSALESETVERMLRSEAPRWRLEGRAIRRVYAVNGFKSAMLAANAIGHLAEQAWHHPEITISWGRVEVVLWSHDAGGVTARDLALARRIEDALVWRPDAAGPLEGAPADPAHAYILPDG
ncbi:MAG: 4a-hydroxytetrahydrobiopterin dehydratase [Beijerinckiaceae bacterium]|jgi:4a-hydroxytetrahydrobiopterin dehydratase